jgi:hypothetical protein
VRIDHELEAITLPPIYKRNGQDCFFDPYREKLIPVTPEEIVRQKIAGWIESKMNVPGNCMILEQHLSHYQIASRDRADIVIHEVIESDMLAPIAVVECKADTVMISDKTLEQCFGYADSLNINYAFVTNGVDFLAYRYNKDTDRYIELETPPNYAEMINGELGAAKTYDVIERPSLAAAKDPAIQKEYTDACYIGTATKPSMVAHIINLFECLIDTQKTLSKTHGQRFTIVEDVGVRISSYGNAAGYDFVAPYRCFLIKDKSGNHQIVSFGFNAYGNDQTILCVAIDDFKKSHHALQLLMDRYAHPVFNELRFTHTGRIAVGHSGSGSSKDLLNKVFIERPDLCVNGELRLGAVPTDILLTMDHPAATDLFINLIDYALIRDEYRTAVKNSHKSK